MLALRSSFSIATFPGAILGAQMSGWFSGNGFMFAFGCFMLCASVLIGFKNFRKGERKEESLTLEQLSYSKSIGISISFFVGFISSIFGIGGGLIHVPALIYLMGFPTHMATATSQSILAVSTTVGVITHLIESHIIFSICYPYYNWRYLWCSSRCSYCKTSQSKSYPRPHEHSCLCIGGTPHS